MSVAGRVSSGVTGFDHVLEGGFLQGRSYLLRGGPGAGKTMLGLCFLARGVSDGERVLMLNHSAPSDTVQADAAAAGIDLQGVDILELGPEPELFLEGRTYDVLSPSQAERGPYVKKILQQVEDMEPSRVFVDSLTRLRQLSEDAADFRQQVQAFLSLLLRGGATVVVASGSYEAEVDLDLQYLVHGVVNISFQPDLGRLISVAKHRGGGFREGTHTMKIDNSGVRVFPKLVPDEHSRGFVAETIGSGVPELDEQLHGGVERGTLTMVSGPTGIGKTSLGLQFMKEAAGRGERSVLYTFEEAVPTLVARSAGINIPIAAMMERGTLAIKSVEPLRYSADEFAAMVQADVEQAGTRIVMLDSLSGYRMSIPGNDLVDRVHALCVFLKNMGVTVFLINEVRDITGPLRVSDIGISYLTDTVIFLRYVEMDSALSRVLGVLKKRTSDFEKTIREVTLTKYGIKVGGPLHGMRGIMGGITTHQE